MCCVRYLRLIILGVLATLIMHSMLNFITILLYSMFTYIYYILIVNVITQESFLYYLYLIMPLIIELKLMDACIYILIVFFI